MHGYTLLIDPANPLNGTLNLTSGAGLAVKPRRSQADNLSHSLG
ncbi:hypothetical protein WBJ53_11725 [Spirosoma sp. SC4-14]